MYRHSALTNCTTEQPIDFIILSAVAVSNTEKLAGEEDPGTSAGDFPEKPLPKL